VSGIGKWADVNTNGTNQQYRQMASADLTFSSDGVNFSNLREVSFSYVLTTEPIPVQTRFFDEVSNVTHIRMVGTAASTSDRLGVSEVKFGAIPEPTTALLGGLGLLVLLRRRR